MARTFDPYRALGVRRDANEADVKSAHRKLAKRFHPDAASGDTGRFLDVQEAYRVLSDPLLRREWDAQHAPGPIRADRPAPAPRREPREKREPRAPEPSTRSEARSEDTSTGGARPSAGAAGEPSNRSPRSSRSYTWSAAEVPWWEEGASENRRRSRGPAGPAGPADNGAAPAGPAAGQPQPPADTANPFDVYNRSSGAAWSMAARAYFRRGDQELPRRGTFHYEGTQVLTGARARAAAETEARRRKAQQTRQHSSASAPAAPRETAGRDSQPTPEARHRTAAGAGAGAGAGGAATATRTFASPEAGISRDARRVYQLRQAMRRRTAAATWPSLRERLLYALLAWVPAAIVIGYGGAVATGCDGAGPVCPEYLGTGQALAIALVLGAFVAFPRVAYIGALAAAGALLVGLVVVGFMAFSGVDLPLPTQLTAVLGATMLVAYLVSGAAALLRNSRAGPWSSGARP